MSNTVKQISNGISWTLIERVVTQGVTFVISVFLARLLMPEQYGIIALVLIFIDIANVFVESGFPDALIQKKNADFKDFSTMFCCSFGSSIILYLLLFCTAPFIASFYENESLVPIVRILAFRLPLGSINSIQRAYVAKKMDFKKLFYSSSIGSISSGVIGIILALNGMGVWALVAQYLINILMSSIVLLIMLPWRPRLQFSRDSAEQLTGFGIKMIISSLINTLYSEAQSLIIGKLYSANDLAYYKRGEQFPSLLSKNICSAIATVMFPAITNNTNDASGVKFMTRKMLKTTSFLVFPLIAGLMAASKTLVILLLTDKWLGCVPYLLILSIAYGMQPIQSAHAQAIKAMGEGSIYLRMEVIKKIIGIVFLVVSMKLGVKAITISWTMSVLIGVIITMLPNVQLINYTLKEQTQDLFPAIIGSLIMFLTVYPISLISIAPILILLIQVLIGIAIYILVEYLLRNDQLQFFISFIRKK